MTLPPTELTLEQLRLHILPAAGGAALVTGLFLVSGRWAGALGSAVAVVVAFAASNYTFASTDWDSYESYSMIPWKPVGEPPPAWHWLPRAAVVLVLIGLLSRWLGLIAGRLLTRPVTNYMDPDAPPERVGRYWWGANLMTWAPRVAAVAVVSGWVVPEKTTAEWVWVRPALAGAMLLSWFAYDGLARGGASAQVAGYQFAVLLAAGLVLLYHHWAAASEIAMTLGFAMFGVAVVTGPARADASGAVPAGVALLPGLLLAGRLSQDSNVPLSAFWLIALAPLTLLPFLIPAVGGLPRWVVVPLRAVFVLTPLVVAVVLADRHEQLAFGEQW